MKRSRALTRVLAASLTAITYLTALFILVSHSFPAFSLGKQVSPTPLSDINEALIYLMWEARFPDLLAQAAVTLLAAAACISIVRLWRGRSGS